jgi:hypothetical protein
VRPALLVLIGLLYLVSIPWYRESGASTPLWLGLPEWVTVAVACYAAVAVLNALAWLLTDIPESEEDLEADASGSEADASSCELDDHGGAG